MAITIKARAPKPFAGTVTPYFLRKWRNGSKGFFAWLGDVKPHILDADGKWVPYEVPSDLVRKEIADALDSKAGTLVFCWPRRHGKTLVSSLIILWRFMCLPNQSVALVANSARQAVDVCYRLIRGAVEHTPYLKSMVEAGDLIVKSTEILYPDAGSIITGFPNVAGTLYGLRLSVAQKSELHATRDPEVFEALSGSTLDTKGGLILVDSTVGSRQSPLWTLHQAAQDGDTDIHISHISYQNLEQAVANKPDWISTAKLRSLAKTMLPAVFEQQHLNLWGSGTNALFPTEIVDRCRDNYPLDLAAITEGGPYAVGGGLDRAYGFSLGGDATVTACVVRSLIEEQDHFHVLAAESVLFSTEAGIKGNLLRYAKEFDMTRCCIESYNAGDIFSWCAHQDFEAELISPTRTRQAAAFTQLHQLAKEGRLHIHPSFEKLFSELETFEYYLDGKEGGKDTLPKFQGAGNAHDDQVYAIAWAVYSLLSIDLNPYQVESIICNSELSTARLCVLNGGLQVPMCSKECRSFAEVRTLYERYLNNGQVTNMAFEDFVPQMVSNTGFQVIPR